MRDLSIAYGNGRTAKFWSNKTIRFDELCDRLRSPIYTSETAEEYPKLPKGQRDDIKDKGGFVAGHLRDNRRAEHRQQNFQQGLLLHHPQPHPGASEGENDYSGQP